MDIASISEKVQFRDLVQSARGRMATGLAEAKERKERRVRVRGIVGFIFVL